MSGWGYSRRSDPPTRLVPASQEPSRVQQPAHHGERRDGDFGVVTAGILRSGDDLFEINLDERVSTVFDAEEQERLRWGRLGEGPRDYGIEIRNEDGDLILSSGGEGVAIGAVLGENLRRADGTTVVGESELVAAWNQITAGNASTFLASAAIGDAFIANLTASKILAGTVEVLLTLGAGAIRIDGVNSLIRSDNYSAGSIGWQIDAAGNAEFNAATIRGTLDGVDGTFSGNLSAAGGTFTGSLSAAGGTFSGDLTAALFSAEAGVFSGGTPWSITSLNNVTAVGEVVNVIGAGNIGQFLGLTPTEVFIQATSGPPSRRHSFTEFDSSNAGIASTQTIQLRPNGASSGLYFFAATNWFVNLSVLPTSDPNNAGQLYRDGTDLRISTG